MTEEKNRRAARQSFEAFLRGRRMRVTAERMAILDGVMRRSGHFSAEEFGLELENQGFHVSAATIYSTFELLCQSGLLRSHRFGRKVEYEQATRSSNHVHLVCTQCGKIKEAPEGELTEAVRGRRFVGFQPAWYTLQVYGLCSQCRRKKKKS